MARLGIHTHITDERKPYANHVSISFEDDDGTITYYGLYPAGAQEVPRSQKLRSYHAGGNDLRKNIDKVRPATHSHYADLNEDQAAEFMRIVKLRHEYEPERNHCLDWAMNAWEHTTGQTLDATQQSRDGGKVVYAQTPIGLEDHLLALAGLPARRSYEPPPPEPRAQSFSETVVSAIYGFLGRGDRVAPEPPAPSASDAAEREAHQDKARRYRADQRETLWHEPARVADEVDRLAGEFRAELEGMPPEDRDRFIVDIASSTAADVVDRRAEVRWTTRDAAYYQYFDEQGREEYKVPRFWPSEERSPAQFARDYYEPLAKAAEDRERAKADRKPGRTEYESGSHIEPDTPGRPRELGD